MKIYHVTGLCSLKVYNGLLAIEYSGIHPLYWTDTDHTKSETYIRTAHTEVDGITSFKKMKDIKVLSCQY